MENGFKEKQKKNPNQSDDDYNYGPEEKLHRSDLPINELAQR